MYHGKSMMHEMHKITKGEENSKGKSQYIKTFFPSLNGLFLYSLIFFSSSFGS